MAAANNIALFLPVVQITSKKQTVKEKMLFTLLYKGFNGTQTGMFGTLQVLRKMH